MIWAEFAARLNASENMEDRVQKRSGSCIAHRYTKLDFGLPYYPQRIDLRNIVSLGASMRERKARRN